MTISMVVFIYLFMFISAKSLKIHSKSQKIHKMESPIMLDSTRMDLHGEHMIYYVLAQSF
jgi:hypothetical protein